MKVQVKLFNPNCKFEYIDKGEWIDLKSAKTVKLGAPHATTLSGNRTKRTVEFSPVLLPLGIGMRLPKGYEAVLLPRSSTFKYYGSIVSNSQGVIDSTYCGPEDEWKLPLLPILEGEVKEGEKICQFRIQLSQKATIWQKIKWLFNNKIKFEFVSEYSNEVESRGGFGTTGK